MAKFRVRYVGQCEIEIEADGQGEAEMEAAESQSDRWIAEELEEEEEV